MLPYIIVFAVFILVFMAIAMIANYVEEGQKIKMAEIDMHNNAIELQREKLRAQGRPQPDQDIISLS